eukprot:gene23653-28659_t
MHVAVTILDTQPVTKLTKYLEANDTLRELENFYTQRAVNEITKQWSPTIGLAIRFRLGLSMENYDRLRLMLSKSVDTESNVSTTWYVMDATSKDNTVRWRVKAPKLPTNHDVDKLRDEIATKLCRNRNRPPGE